MKENKENTNLTPRFSIFTNWNDPYSKNAYISQIIFLVQLHFQYIQKDKRINI